ncbi:MAG: hypothetical protein C4329_09050 [Chitinophagaceae bacterium]
MPRQTFLTKETFLAATEIELKKILHSLPEVMPDLSLVGENKLIEQIRFAFNADIKLDYFIDFSVLPVNDQYCRLSLHATHKNGKAFITDPEMHAVLHDIETAVHALAKGEVYCFPTKQKIKSKTKTAWIASFKNSFAVFLLKKKFS